MDQYPSPTQPLPILQQLIRKSHKAAPGHFQACVPVLCHLLMSDDAFVRHCAAELRRTNEGCVAIESQGRILRPRYFWAYSQVLLMAPAPPNGGGCVVIDKGIVSSETSALLHSTFPFWEIEKEERMSVSCSTSQDLRSDIQPSTRTQQYTRDLICPITTTSSTD